MGSRMQTYARLPYRTSCYCVRRKMKKDADIHPMHSFVSLYITAVICHRSGSFINLIPSAPTQNSECSRNNKEKKCPSAFLQVRCERGLGSHSGIVAICLFPQKKQNSEAVHLRLRAASKQADPKSTRSDGPTRHTLSCFPNI